ncbi:MAG: LysR substrate-binding domain-containing protein, partial [Alphaproteobacteria bacterium]|nr:LysR substrate-binding domain-containing protein [Alphaproteobacteria bacterium]
GAPLLDRQARPAGLTEAGQRFQLRARAILREVDEARSDMAKAPAREPLRLGLADELAIAPIAGCLAAFGAAHPDIALRLVEAAPDALGQRLAGGRLDAALTLAGAASPRQRPLYRERTVAALPPHHALGRMPALRLEHLHGQALVVWTGLHDLRDLRRGLAAAAAEPLVVCRTGEIGRAAALVAAGVGLCLLPASAIPPGTARRPLEPAAAARTVVLDPAAPPHGRPLEALIDFTSRHGWPSGQRRDPTDIAH